MFNLVLDISKKRFFQIIQSFTDIFGEFYCKYTYISLKILVAINMVVSTDLIVTYVPIYWNLFIQELKTKV